MTNRNRIRNWAITFPQTDCERKDFVESFPPYEKVICCREEHNDGGFHLHLGISLKKSLSKVRMLKWIKARWPNDYKRIDVQATYNIGTWADYISKEDPDVYKDESESMKAKKIARYMAKVKELSTAAQGYDNSTSWKGAIEVRKLKERWCTGCNTVCAECETLWREYWKKMEEPSK